MFWVFIRSASVPQREEIRKISILFTGKKTDLPEAMGTYNILITAPDSYQYVVGAL